jgi:hypothetical protein
MTLQRVFASEHLYRDWCDKCQYAKPALPMAALLRTLTQYSQPAHAAAHACSDAMGGLLWLSHLFLQHRADRDRHQPPLKRRMRSCNMLRAAARASKPSKSPRRRRQAPRSGCTPSRTNCLARLALVGVSTLAPQWHRMGPMGTRRCAWNAFARPLPVGLSDGVGAQAQMARRALAGPRRSRRSFRSNCAGRSLQRYAYASLGQRKRCHTCARRHRADQSLRSIPKPTHGPRGLISSFQTWRCA